MLEAYCRGNSLHLNSMIKQVEMISTLTALSVIIRSMGNKDAANKRLQQELQIRKEEMQHMCSPLNPTDCLGELLVEECRVLGSAKLPLRLTWRNPEVLAQISTPTHQLIFKNGDDMRQDMLTLQVMRIMDSKWKHQNIDFCMTLYEVLPMGRNIGLIHVVQNCQTIFHIQCEAKQMGSSFNMDVNLLNKYIYQKCSNDSKQYMECVDRFKFSLAGYCIATYVIGIKDRHQDNIMLAKDGRIFHIDFGHFLGHTKRKLGINRERTEFVLTDHFLYVISRGRSDFRSTHDYERFRESCVKGFMIIYHNARFFIALFRLMLCMGLPELSVQDIEFLRTSLMYEQMERKDVQVAFQHIFEDVIKSGWFTSINWFFHSVKHLSA
uniref:PI3K/PI4K catalytic domain-containing protein n=1 Tax=Ditylenchus dipsaci TaxID=166011 RepID=A0A915DE63_9BILA